MCCQGLVQVRTLAAEFCTYWSLSRVLEGSPDRTPLTVIQVGGDEGMDEGLSHRFEERGPESKDVSEMVKS